MQLLFFRSLSELKLLYHPLDADQETKYRAFRSRKDGVTEIRPGENGAGGEIFQKPIEIPEVAVSNEKFNTVNLQEAIKKNIEEIMKASEAGEVTENLEAIKELVGDLPFAKTQEKDPTEELPVIKAESQRIDDTLKLNFKEYLEEELEILQSCMQMLQKLSLFLDGKYQKVLKTVSVALISGNKDSKVF